MVDFNARARERRIAAEIAAEIQRRIGPMAPEALELNQGLLCEVFADFFDRYAIHSEAAGARILLHVPKLLADQNRSIAELNRKFDIAIRPPPAPPFTIEFVKPRRTIST